MIWSLVLELQQLEWSHKTHYTDQQLSYLSSQGQAWRADRGEYW